MLPIVKVQPIADLIGQQNGRLDPSILSPCPRLGAATDRAHHLAVRAYFAMAADMRKQTDIILTFTDAYRTCDEQVSLFRQRFHVIGSYVKGAKWYEDKWWFLDVGEATAATPCTSNHGIGRAWDLAEWNGARIVGISSKAVGWLVTNAHKYGFSFELESEPWHVRFFANTLTPAVLAYEAQNQPGPALPPPAPAPVGGDDLVSLVAIGSACKRQPNGRMQTFDATVEPDGRVIVVGSEGVPIKNRTGHAYGNDFIEFPREPDGVFKGITGPVPDHGGVIAKWSNSSTKDILA